MAVKLLENRALALTLAVLTVLGSTVWNVNSHLREYTDEIDAAWTEKYGAKTQLQDRCSYASQLWSLCQSHEELSGESKALRDAYNGLYESMEDGDLTRVDSYNTDLDLLAGEAKNALCALPDLSDEDKEFAERYVNYMENAGRMLRDSRYNELCAEYDTLCGSPWLRMLRPVISVDTPCPIGE